MRSHLPIYDAGLTCGVTRQLIFRDDDPPRTKAPPAQQDRGGCLVPTNYLVRVPVVMPCVSILIVAYRLNDSGLGGEHHACHRRGVEHR